MAIKIFRFSANHFDWESTDEALTKKTLGGKGAALVKMAQAGMPVPPGFTITTDTCNEFRLLKETQTEEVVNKWFDKLMDEVNMNMKWLADQFGYTPLVSVRSGAPVSMPGMMDTILNVGLTYDNLPEWEKRLGKRAAMDSMRRLIQMLGSTAYGVPHEVFEFQLAKHKKEVGVESDTDLTADDLEFISQQYLKAFFANKGFDFPINDSEAQLRAAVKAVFDSWMNPRAIEYRKLNNIPEDMGTAVNVQAMVFGNMGDDSGTGVLFTRDPSTGHDEIMGEFLQNAQGEDVVAGIRTPRPLKEMESLGGAWVDVANEILMICEKLEEMYKDMVDVEFTVQQGTLFILQSRVGKRSAKAAFRIATDLVEEGVITVEQALKRVTKDQYKAVRRPRIDPSFKEKPNVVGLPACPGVVSGKPVFSAEDAVNCKEPCILITHETTPDDIKGMNAAVGILTQTGGATSHAAVVARAMDKPCVVGCTDLDISFLKSKSIKSAFNRVTIDGSTGNVWFDIEVPVVDDSSDPAVRKIVEYCLEALDVHESVSVPQGAGAPKHVIHVAHWWGSEEVLVSVLDELEQIGSFENVILDVTSPRALMPSSDFDLYDCFGHSEPSFSPRIGEELKKRGNKLKELVTTHFGFGPKVMPADYAVFKMLSQ